MASNIRHRKTSSAPSSPPRKRSPPAMDPTAQQVQVQSLSLTSLLTTLTTSEVITTTARKLYTYPTKRLSSSELWRKYKADEEGSSSGSVTPPPDYEEESLAITSHVRPTAGSAVSMATPALGSQLSQPVPESEDTSIVSAKFATQGHNLLSLSLTEPPNSSFRRHLYLDSIPYLLRALPSDLTASESTQLVSSLPPSLVAAIQPTPLPETSQLPGRPVVDHPTIHALLSLVTATTVSSIRNLTPHVRSLAQSTWEFNLKYRVAERGIDSVRSSIDSGLCFWKGVVQWVMYDESTVVVVEELEDGEEGKTATRRTIRYGGGIVRDLGKYAGGIVRSGVAGVMEGFVEGMRV